MTTKICYLSSNNLLTPIPHIRLLGPSYLEDIEVHSVNVENKELNNEKLLSECQLLILDRDTPNNYHCFKKISKLAHLSGIPIVYDIDDFLFELPENHPDRESFVYTRSLIPMFEALLVSDYVTVSTEKLMELLNPFNSNIYTLPNYLDDFLWPFHLPIKIKKTKQITIGYMGGESHKPDIEWITPVLEKINQEYPGKIIFHFYGVKPPEEFLSLPNVNHTSITTYIYKKFINDFHILNVDIFIAPLIDNLFNRCKSPIKYFEYSTLGVPSILSNIEPYQNVVVDKENGFLAKSHDEWFEKLVTLIQEPDLRYKLAKNAQETVRSNWLMSENAHLWTETFKNFIQMGPQENTNRDLVEIIESISLQLHDYHQYQETIIAENDAFSNILVDREKVIEDQNEQILRQERNIQVLKEKIERIESSNKTLSVKLSEQMDLVRSLNEKLSIKKKELSSASAQLTKKELLCANLEAQIDNLNKELSIIDSQLADKEQTINKLKEKAQIRSKELTSHNSQLTEKIHVIQQFEKQIDDQNLEMNLIKMKLSELEEEILFYSLSKSWRLTRPLRKIMSLLKGEKDS